MRTVIVAVLLALTWAAAPDTASAQALGTAERDSVIPSKCVECHGAEAMGKLQALTHADTISCLTCHHLGFTNDPEVAKARRVAACKGCHEDHLPATHVDVAAADAPECTDCHSIHSDPPDPAEADRQISARCTACHTMEHPLHANAGANKPECTQCHTSHSGKSFDPHDHEVVGGCLECHASAHPTHDDVEGVLQCMRCHTEAERPAEMAMRMSGESECSSCHGDKRLAHGEFSEMKGERVDCLACHDFNGDTPVAMSGEQMSARCASCHEDAMKGVLSGGHAKFLSDEDAAALRNCLTCHTTHVEPSEERALLRRKATESCIRCHSEGMKIEKYGLQETVTKSYTDDFHGATMEFLANQIGGNYPAVMVCSDCHGAHDVGWKQSDVIADVCLRCHQEGDERLAGAWLGHQPVGPDNQALIWAVKTFYYFLIPFMLIGLFLNILFHLIDQRRDGARIMQTEGMRRLLARLRRQKLPKLQTVTRFSLVERWEHFGSMVTFLTLVVTGLPQTRPDLGVARSIIDFFGGIGTTRIIHRTTGVIFVLLMLTHVARAVVKAVREHRMPAMVPTRQDFEDVLQTFRHYLFGEPRPRVGKFDFSEKFEYWGLFLGGIVMSSTGLVLMFPELVSQFLPGVIIAATRVMHGLEATFAVMVVILWHSYGVIFRPEVFPLDTSIFTGKMDLHRLKHEHELEYDRLFPEQAAGD
jgi:formate dehydrogenase subunit gamma